MSDRAKAQQIRLRLKKSMDEEVAAYKSYLRRAEYIRQMGEFLGSAEFFEHIAQEEHNHYLELLSRYDSLGILYPGL